MIAFQRCRPGPRGCRDKRTGKLDAALVAVARMAAARGRSDRLGSQRIIAAQRGHAGRVGRRGRASGRGRLSDRRGRGGPTRTAYPFQWARTPTTQTQSLSMNPVAPGQLRATLPDAGSGLYTFLVSSSLRVPSANCTSKRASCGEQNLGHEPGAGRMEDRRTCQRLGPWIACAASRRQSDASTGGSLTGRIGSRALPVRRSCRPREASHARVRSSRRRTGVFSINGSPCSTRSSWLGSLRNRRHARRRFLACRRIGRRYDIEPGLFMTEVSQLLLRHRSIRSYKPDPIDPALVEQICGDAIAGSSSSGNLNSVSMVLTRDSERKRRLYELHFEQEMILEAPLVIPSAPTGTARGSGCAGEARATTSAISSAITSQRSTRSSSRSRSASASRRGSRHLLHGHDAPFDDGDRGVPRAARHVPSGDHDRGRLPGRGPAEARSLAARGRSCTTRGTAARARRSSRQSTRSAKSGAGRGTWHIPN